MADPISDFIGAMEASGIRPVEPVAARLATGSLRRLWNRFCGHSARQHRNAHCGSNQGERE